MEISLKQDPAVDRRGSKRSASRDDRNVGRRRQEDRLGELAATVDGDGRVHPTR
jgi:hypothetical protein